MRMLQDQHCSISLQVMHVNFHIQVSICVQDLQAKNLRKKADFLVCPEPLGVCSVHQHLLL